MTSFFVRCREQLAQPVEFCRAIMYNCTRYRLSLETCMAKNQKKICSDGQYQDFNGITIISKVQYAATDFWSLLNAAFEGNELVQEYYQPLPKTSYHMTAINLFTQNSSPERNLNKLIKNDAGYFKSLSSKIQTTLFDIEVQIKGILVTKKSCKLIVTIPYEQVQLINELAKKFNISNKIPQLFHITLGYSFKKIGYLAQLQLQYQLHKKLSSLLDQYGSLYELVPPQLCYFKNMLAYHAWSGFSSPFRSELMDKKSSTLTFFNESKTSKFKSLEEPHDKEVTYTVI